MFHFDRHFGNFQKEKKKNLRYQVSLTNSKQTFILQDDAKSLMKSTLPFKPDPDRLDPHMEALCRKVRKFSVSTAEPTNLGPLEQVDGCLASKEFDVSDTNANATNEVTDDPSGTDLQGHSEKHQLRLQNDWIARSLTSIAPR